MAGAATEVLFNHIAMHVDSDYIYFFKCRIDLYACMDGSQELITVGAYMLKHLASFGLIYL